jgi:acetyl esterase/lipase
MTAIFRDIVYSRPAGFRPLSLDLYVPATPAAARCVYLHGGGWRVGSRADGPGAAKSWTPSFFERVAGMGLAVASVDYRLSAEATFPAQIQDVGAAIDFLAGNRAAFGITTTRTVAWGVSAGAHLAALAALAPAEAPGRPAEASGRSVGAVVCWYPPTDLDALAKDIDDAGGRGDRGAGSREGQLIGADLDAEPELTRRAGPVNHVRPGAPPFLFLHGDADLAVPVRQSERLAQALWAVGAEATVEIIPGASHMFPELDETATLAVVARSVRFLTTPPAESDRHRAGVIARAQPPAGGAGR